MHTCFIRLVYRVDDKLVVFLVLDKIKLVGVENQNPHVIGLTEIVEIARLYVVEIGVLDFLLVAASAFFDVALEVVNIEIEVNKQVGFVDVAHCDVEESREQTVFVLLEVVAREDERFDNEIVGDDEVVEHVVCRNLVFHLLIPRSHECHFKREGVFVGLLVELGQKRIVLELLKDKLAVEIVGYFCRKSGLAGSQSAFYGYEIIQHRLAKIIK